MGRRLKALREAQGLSRQALAELAGISRESVRLLEAGRFDPTLGMLTKLARALKTTLPDLMK
ncbi:MAG TPA: helix-turn-helix transcriptional regulator [Candidatus Methylomirabilis sp.]|nr:helix-turn-helix transcriptional regulator [Candidatus Methylomirabilis sp.]